MGDAAEILVLGEPKWKVKRNHVQETCIQETVDDGTFQLGSDQMESLTVDISNAILPVRATGISLSDIMPPAPEPAVQANQQQGSPVPQKSIMFKDQACPVLAPPFLGRSQPGIYNQSPVTKGSKNQKVSGQGAAQRSPADPKPAAGSGSKRGRPKNAEARAEEMLKEFSESLLDDVRFFGAGKQNRQRRLGRLVDATQEHGSMG